MTVLIMVKFDLHIIYVIIHSLFLIESSTRMVYFEGLEWLTEPVAHYSS